MYAKHKFFSWAILCLSVNVLAKEEKSNKTEESELAKLSPSLGILSFALKLTKELYDIDSRESVIFSPMSIVSALGISHLAASGVTRDEIADAINFPKEEKDIRRTHEAMGEMIKYLQKPANSTVSIANGFFLQKSIDVSEDFAQKIQKVYNSEIVNVDFTKDGRLATDYINQWINNKTRGHIPKLYKDQLPESTRITLANSLYFSARWQYPFNSLTTSIEKFDTGFEKIEVPMMNNQKELYYLNYPQGSYEAIALPYENEEFTMYIAMPYANHTLKKMIQELSVSSLTSAIKDAVKTNVDYKIPHMKFGSSASIKQQLRNLGIKKLFEKADLNNMVPSAMELSVTDVNHGAEIEVKEWGTEASAVTGVTYNAYSAKLPPQDIVKFHVNRPFMFFICQQDTSAVLFSAVVRRPSKITDAMLE